MDRRYDAIVVGGGHNGLVAAAYLARAGRSVLVLERLPRPGGAAVSERPFAGVDADVSRYAYLVSLLPRRIVEDLSLDITTRRRRIAWCTPTADRTLLADRSDPAATRAAFGADADGWDALGALTARAAQAIFPTMLEPLPAADDVRARMGEEAWTALVERPLGETIEAHLQDDALRGTALTDGLIGTFARAHDADLRQNRCFLYHVIGGGTGDWDLPVGGMGTVTGALAARAAGLGAVLRCGVEVTAVDADDDGAVVRWPGGEARAAHVLAGVAPQTLAVLMDRPAPEPAPQGAQLKVNMVLSRLPRLRDGSVEPERAFAGTLHVHEGYAELDAAYTTAAAGGIPALLPCETYCHSLTDPTILGADLRAAGAHTLTVFGLHLPAAIVRADPDGARDRALAATLRALDDVLDEPIGDCLLADADGRPCLEATTPLDLEEHLGLPGGNIFHRDLQWPFAADEEQVGTWGTETDVASVHLCGAGARRGGGVSGIPGHNAAMAVLAAG